MPGCYLEGEREGLLLRVLLEAFEKTDIPVLFGVPGNITVPFGVDALLDGTAGGLELEEAGVA